MPNPPPRMSLDAGGDHAETPGSSGPATSDMELPSALSPLPPENRRLLTMLLEKKVTAGYVCVCVGVSTAPALSRRTHPLARLAALSLLPSNSVLPQAANLYYKPGACYYMTWQIMMRRD